MRKLKIDIELLMELGLKETRGEGECYINLNDGEFAYIPQNIIESLKNKELYDSLESWEKELASVAEDIIMNYSENYLYIPLIDENILLEGMKKFIVSLTDDKQKLLNSKIDWDNAFLTFNRVLLDADLLDQYYDFRDSYLTEFLKKWLKDNNIEII